MKSAVEEANRGLRSSGLQVEILDWQEDTRPTVGLDGQDVINRQLCDDADLAIVLVHDRVGTPTPRYPSGTVEEAEIFLERVRSGEAADLLVFFKNPTPKLSRSSLDELSKVLDFKESLEGRGVFWRLYSDQEDLGRLIRLHIGNAIMELHRKATSIPGAVVVVADKPVAEGALAEDELGALDYEIQFAEALESLSACASALTSAGAEVGARMNAAAPSIEILGGAAHRDPREIRRSINNTVEYITHYGGTVGAQIPVMKSSSEALTAAVIGMVSMSGDEIRAGDGDLASLREVSLGLRQTVLDVAGSLDSQRDALSEIPRMTRELNVAKRVAIENIDQLRVVMFDFSTQMDEVIGAIEDREDYLKGS